jgi:anaerobic selenocysteine-containing dehydrogenase
MVFEAPTETEVATFCPLCVSRCGARATVTNGTFTLSRDPSHPTGKALCVKGKAAADISAHPDRLQHPLKFWGYNPVVSRLAHATATRAALRRGAKLVIVDPRRDGLASKADPWLRVRPGTDAALALAITNVMIERGWYDDPFVRRWTNGPLLVRIDTGRFLRAGDLAPGGDSGHYVAWDEVAEQPVVVDPVARGTDIEDHGRLALVETVEVATVEGAVACQPAFGLIARQCSATSRRSPRESPASTPPRSNAPPGCCGSTAPSRSTPGAASSSRATRPRSSGPSTCSTR